MDDNIQTPRVTAYKWMLAASVAFAYAGAGICTCMPLSNDGYAIEGRSIPADQGSDVFVVANLISSGKPLSYVTGLAALFFILLFAMTSGIKVVGSGRGAFDFLLALTGMDVGLRCDECCSRCRGPPAIVLGYISLYASDLHTFKS